MTTPARCRIAALSARAPISSKVQGRSSKGSSTTGILRGPPRLRASEKNDAQVIVVRHTYRLADVGLTRGHDRKRHAARDHGLQRFGVQVIEQLIARSE